MFDLTVLLQHGADPNIRNTDGKTPLDLADPPAKVVLTGEYKKDELLEASRGGNEEKLMSLLTPLNVNCHASDGRRVGINQVYNCDVTKQNELELANTDFKIYSQTKQVIFVSCCFTTFQLPVSLELLTNFNRVCCKR